MNTRKILIALVLIVFVGGGFWYYLRARHAAQPVPGGVPSAVSTSAAGVIVLTSTPHVTPPTTPPPAKRQTPPVTGSGIRGIAQIGPTCPVQPAVDPTGKCADRPFSGKFEIKSSIGTVVKTFSTGSTGTFSVSLPAGTYSIGPLPGTYYPRMIPQVGIVVKANQYTSVTIKFDSGIR